MDKPDVDYIEGLSPAISIDQKSTSRNPRSTVGTVTEIYDYLRLLYARVGRPHCPKCGQPFSSRPPSRSSTMLTLPEGARIRSWRRWSRAQGRVSRSCSRTSAQTGFVRVRVDGEVRDLRRRSDARQADSTRSRSWSTGWSMPQTSVPDAG